MIRVYQSLVSAFNPLDSKGKYSATSNNTKLVGPAQAPPRCTKCNSPAINGQCTDHNIAIWWSDLLPCNRSPISGSCDIVTPSLQQLHWLAACQMPYHKYKLCIVKYQVHTGRPLKSSLSHHPGQLPPVSVCHPDDNVFVPPAADTMA